MRRWLTMIDVVARRTPDRWRHRWLAFLGLVVVVSSGFLVGCELQRSASVAHTVTQPSTYPSAPLVAAAGAPTATSPPAATPPRLTLAAHGSGIFRYAGGRGPVLGGKGQLRRFKVAVEQDSGEDVAAFAEQVEKTLGDSRSWVGGGTVRLQLVAGTDAADFTVFLATRDTAAEMCARGGIDIRINRVPYTSCRVTGKAIINLDRWRLSARPYVTAGVPLPVYRQYVINHEVGHELGHRHQGCPRAGGPAPVMVQQTLTTRGCVPYAWPRTSHGFLIGPPV